MIEKTFTTFGILGLILFLIGLLVLGPCLTIFAVNQLFGTAIQITFWNWLSVAWLHTVAVGNLSKS